MAELLSLEEVTYSYPLPGRGEAPAVSGLTLSVEPGATLCIAGPNGSGKSTLAQLIAGLLSPVSGTVRYGGEVVEGRSALRAYRSKVGLLFQSPEDQLFADTVRRDIAFGPRNAGVRGDGLTARVEEAATHAGIDLDEWAERSPFTLSEGEKRRVALAGVLAMEPEVLVLDEPFIGLDFEGRDTLKVALRQYREARGATVIIVTHELADAWELSDSVALIDNGRVALEEDRRGLVAEAGRVRSMGMHLPQWGELAGELASRGCEVEDPCDLRALSAVVRRIKGGRC